MVNKTTDACNYPHHALVLWLLQDIDGPALDIWCLGCILFSMLCGKLPFDDGKLSEFRIPDDPTMIERTNTLDYKFNMPSLSEEAKSCVARQLIVDKSARASIPMLFNHPWMMHRRDSEVDFGAQTMRDLKAVAMRGGETRRPSYFGTGDSDGGVDGVLTKADIFMTGPPSADRGRDRLGSSPDVEGFFKLGLSPKFGAASGGDGLPPLSPLNANGVPDPFVAETAEVDAATARVAQITTLGIKMSNKGRGNVLGHIKRKTSKAMSPMLSTKHRVKKTIVQESGSGGGSTNTSTSTSTSTRTSSSGGGGGSASGGLHIAAATAGGVAGSVRGELGIGTSGKFSPIQHSPTPPKSGTPKRFKGKKPGKFGRKQILKKQPKGVRSKKSSTALLGGPKN
jgi:serine/threonine protein kinase